MFHQVLCRIFTELILKIFEKFGLVRWFDLQVISLVSSASYWSMVVFMVTYLCLCVFRGINGVMSDQNTRLNFPCFKKLFINLWTLKLLLDESMVCGFWSFPKHSLFFFLRSVRDSLYNSDGLERVWWSIYQWHEYNYQGVHHILR